MALPPSKLSKRACCEVNNRVEAVTCVVDGCTADLRNCRKYHQRHKVCEVHSKSPEVSINGQKLRFCQQCSRFHPLEEFDEGKRSCRKRLDGHNRRRRKPRPYLLSAQNGTGTFPATRPPEHITMAVHHQDHAPSLLSFSEASCSFSTTENLLDFGGLENYCDEMIDMRPLHYEGPQTLPFYWQF